MPSACIISYVCILINSLLMGTCILLPSVYFKVVRRKFPPKITVSPLKLYKGNFNAFDNFCVNTLFLLLFFGHQFSISLTPKLLNSLPILSGNSFFFTYYSKLFPGVMPGIGNLTCSYILLL